MLRKLLRWTLRILVAALVLAVVGGAIAVWPLYLLPVTDVRIANVPPQPPADRPAFEAGVAIRDITPPIGLPKFGYSSLAHSSDGFRTRLATRVVCLKPARGEPVALVQADLGASSLVLHHRVAELVAPRTDVAAHNLVVLATHTHSGPAQYLDSDFYNLFGANRPGFDPKMLDFLATRMADAVTEACTKRRAARIGIGQTSVWGLTRNRSLEAWLQNHDVLDKRATAERALEAVNPVLTLVRIDLRADDGRWLPAGAFTSFSIHGTGIPAFRGPWHGDVWAAFEQEIEWAIRANFNPPWPVVHAAFEGTHGDNNPNWREGWRGDEETNRIGTELAAGALRVFAALGPHMSEQATVSSAMREIDLLAAPAEVRAPLCDRAIIGAATAGAANGDEVFPIGYLPLLQEGWPRRVFRDGCHAEKQWLLSGLQPLGIPADRMPHRAALQVIRINDLTLVALPWEVTREAGNRIGARVSAALRDLGHGSRTVVASHANGYFGYATTPEEYSLQYYEGGHTIYGPGTTEFLARQSARLTTELAQRGSFADLPAQWHFPLATRSYWPEPATPGGERTLLAGPAFVPGEGTQEPYWKVEYLDVAPGALELDRPLLSVQALSGDKWVALGNNGRPIDDQWQRQLQVRWLEDAGNGMARYELRWNTPPVTPNFSFRFAVAARAGLPEWYSPPFPR